MQSSRSFWFLVSIVLGMAGGLVLGWLVLPQPAPRAGLDALRTDYRTDTVLMIAEVYDQDGNLPLATRRLNLLGGDNPLRLVQQAILTGQELNYAKRDIAQLGKLAQALQALPGSTP